VWAIDLTWVMEGTNYGDSGDHTLTIGSCECEVSLKEGDPNTVSVAFTSYGSISGNLALS
jgi:hypothetical protein